MEMATEADGDIFIRWREKWSGDQARTGFILQTKKKMAGAHFVRKRLRLTTDEGVYEGLCTAVDPVSRRITLVQGLHLYSL